MPLIPERKSEIYLIMENIFKEAPQLDITDKLDKPLADNSFTIYLPNKEEMDLSKINMSHY